MATGDITSARLEEQSYPCDECGAAPGEVFFVGQWVCGECCHALRVWLSWEPYLSVKEWMMTEKKYTAPYTKTQIRHAQVGNIFDHHGVKMRITRVGDPYNDGSRTRAFDSWAVPVLEKQK
jgi:hypothetical protein